MGLDAVVYCDCLERGDLKKKPDPEWEVYIDEDGARCSRVEALEVLLEFDQWSDGYEACTHEGGVLVHHRIGNMSTVAYLRQILSPYKNKLPILMQKVIYSGTHAGDYVPVNELESLKDEIDIISKMQMDNQDQEISMRYFVRQMKELVECALSVRKPISF